ncbi:NusG domain II-containing protein [Enterococcus hirae]|nr:NusG domain II-containing protein [Enterococcus hirae]
MKKKRLFEKYGIKRWDLILIVLIALVSVAPFGWMIYTKDKPAQPAEVVIRADGKIKKRLLLNENQTYLYRAKDGDENLIEIKDQRVRIKEANCRDQICVRKGWIAKSGESIVCLPHKLVVEIRASDQAPADEVIY